MTILSPRADTAQNAWSDRQNSNHNKHGYHRKIWTVGIVCALRFIACKERLLCGCWHGLLCLCCCSYISNLAGLEFRKGRKNEAREGRCLRELRGGVLNAPCLVFGLVIHKGSFNLRSWWLFARVRAIWLFGLVIRIRGEVVYGFVLEPGLKPV